MGCECVSEYAHGELRERMREHRSWCDDKLNDPSATLCIFAAQMPCQRITVANQHSTAESRWHRSPWIWATVNMHALRR